MWDRTWDWLIRNILDLVLLEDSKVKLYDLLLSMLPKCVIHIGSVCSSGVYVDDLTLHEVLATRIRMISGCYSA